MSDQDTQSIAEADAPPVSAMVTGMPFNGQDTHVALDPSYVNSHALTLLATNLTPIEWTFDEAAKVYNGAAPYGSFVLERGESGRLLVDFTSACNSHKMRIHIGDGASIAEAKSVTLPRLLESLNQSRRLDLVLPQTAPATIAEEPDLI